MNTVACLAGDGVGPELMAAATRALDGVAKLHGWALDDVHLPFAGEGVTRSGHPLPAETRAGYRERGRDPRRVARRAGARGRQGRPPARLARRAGRARHRPRPRRGRARSDEWANEIALDRAFACAAARRGRILAVGESAAWRAATARVRSAHDGLEVEQAPLGETLVRLRERPQRARRDRHRGAAVLGRRRRRSALRRHGGVGRACVAPGRRPGRLRARLAPRPTTWQASAWSIRPGCC